jgi:chemotaxis protein MotB
MRLAIFGAMSLSMVGGCVGLDQYNQLEFAHRKCEAERQRLVGELASAKVQVRDLQNKLAQAQRELQNAMETINKLRSGSGNNQAEIDRLTKLIQEMANQQIPQAQVTPLPKELVNALKEFAAKYPNMVTFDEKTGVVKFSSDVLFDLGSDVVRDDVISKLEEFAKIISMPEAMEFDAVVVGHTDNIPIGKPETRAKHPTNWHLSAHRAISVMNVLNGGGVTNDRLGVMGYGEFRPVAANDSPANRQLNRRVEVYLVPKHAVGAVDATPSAGDAEAAPAGEAPAVVPVK